MPELEGTRLLYSEGTQQRLWVAKLQTPDSYLANAYALKIEEIGQLAWAESDWLKEIAATPHNQASLADSRNLAAMVFDAEDDEKRQRWLDIIVGRQAGTIAAVFADRECTPPRMLGFAAIRPEVSGTTEKKIAFKKKQDKAARFIPGSNAVGLLRSRVYNKLDVNVSPHDQDQGIAHELLVDGMAEAPGHRRTTFFTDVRNFALTRSGTVRHLFRLTNLNKPKPNTSYFGEDFPVYQLRYESIKNTRSMRRAIAKSKVNSWWP